MAIHDRKAFVASVALAALTLISTAAAQQPRAVDASVIRPEERRPYARG